MTKVSHSYDINQFTLYSVPYFWKNKIDIHRFSKYYRVVNNYFNLSLPAGPTQPFFKLKNPPSYNDRL